MSIILIIVVSINCYIRFCNDNCKAYYLSQHNWSHGPICFENAIYFEDSMVSLYQPNDCEVYGYIQFWNMHPKVKKNHHSFLLLDYFLLNKIGGKDERKEHIQTMGAVYNGYTRADLLENEDRMKEILERNDDFVLIDDYNVYPCSKELVIGMEKKYGVCSYDLNDFINMKPYYLKVDISKNNDIYNDQMSSIYVATIFEEGGNYYYCNSHNLISGRLLNELKKVIEMPSFN